MKVLSFILALIMHIAMLSPCTDTTECRQEPVQVEAGQDHTHHQHSNEQCSPFCSCGCCATIAGFIISDFIQIQAAHDLPVYMEFMTGSMDFLSYEDRNIWQPPQLG